MNMFKKSRKAKEPEDPPFVSSSSEPTTMSKASRALTFKKKKIEIEEKPVFDLNAALPDSNDFRTSLLMPNLSARFSMLREQDDPNSKLGKASDDSVLFPKRASRLNLFGSNPLTDIAEVESIRSSTFRPPFADDGHRASSDGYASDDGASVMNRARPGEGNNLFGGRQKLYKITTGSTRSIVAESMTSGKHTYESDVSLSAFQQMRLREKEERLRQRHSDEKTDRSSYPDADTEDHASTQSPLTSFSQNRGTQSSTNSGPSNRRTSTAATSVVSETPAFAQNHTTVTKVKEQDANSSAESIGFAASPSLRRFREDPGRPPFQLSSSRSAMNMRDNYSRQSPVPQVYRGMSPTLSAASQPMDFGLRETNRSQNSSRFNAASPTGQYESEQEDALAYSVRPNDRGKATALGLFNKPAQHYDDAQFRQRQVQMHEGRNSPMSPTNPHGLSRASPDMISSTNTYLANEVTPQLPPIPSTTSSPQSNRRMSAASSSHGPSSRPRTKSVASVKEDAVKARVQSLIRKQNAELVALEETHLGPQRSQSPSDEAPAAGNNNSNGTFFDASDASDEEGRPTCPSAKSSVSIAPRPPAPLDIHPALRSTGDSLGDFDFGSEARKTSLPRNSNYSARNPNMRKSIDRSRQSEHESVVSVEDLDSPTIPTAGLGLSGLIRTHLRHDSDKSSMLPPPSPAVLGFETYRASVSSTSHTVTESVKSDPFEYDNERNVAPQPSVAAEQPSDATMTMSQKAQQILGTAMAMRDAAAQAEATPKPTSQHQERFGDDHRVAHNGPSHQRNESTETQREMRRFDEDLAARRAKIEEGLKSVQERSRSRSPIAERHGGTQGHGFSLPRFPGRSNTGDRFEPPGQSKAMKMLGIAPSSKEQQQPSPRMPADYPDERARNMSRQGQRTPNPQEHDRPSGRQTPNSRQGHRAGPANGYDRPPPPRSTTPSSRSGGRDRSNSAAADRSTSRNKHIPEFDRSMMPGGFPGSPYSRPSPQHEYGQRTVTPPDRPYERSGSSAAGHYNDQRNYFNAKPLGVDMSEGFTPRPSPRPSPNPAGDFNPQNSQTSLGAPMSPPTSALPSPNPMGGRTTPSSGIHLPGRTTPAGHRKRSVTKHMISEPTFVSSTSTVPLVHLPRDGGPPVEPMIAPPVPAMNPRRRGNTSGGDAVPSPGFGPHPAVRPTASPMMPASELPHASDISAAGQQSPQSAPRQRNKLRKSSSEGGNMAAKARQQALMAEVAREKERAPNGGGFQFTRSATNLGILTSRQEGGMF